MSKRIVKQNANELHDAEVSWISLVDRPANRIPFRIMKAEKPEDKRSTAMINMGLNGLFATSKQDKASPSISAIVLKAEDQERMLPLLKEAGFTVDDLDTDTDGVVIVKQEDFDVDAVVTVKLKNDTAVILSNVEKAFTPYPDTLNFEEKLKAAGFFPSVSMATEALMDTVSAIMLDARSPDEVKTKMDQAIQSYSTFVLNLTDALPVTAFKIEALELPDEGAEAVDTGAAEGAAKAEGAGGAPEGGEDASGGTPAKKEEAPAADTAGGEGTAAKGEATDKEVTKEGEGTGELASLIEMIGAMKSELTEGLTGVRGDLEKVKADTEGFANRIEQVEATAKSAETAVKGTVVTGGEAGASDSSGGEDVEFDSAMSRKSDDSDGIWAGSPVANMLG